MLNPSLKRGHCSVVSDIVDDIPMNSYPGSLNQAVSALLENAMIHGYGEKGGEISLSATQEGSKAVIVVRDNGAGIPEENLGRVFEPFFTTRFGKGGSGLGLHIVYNIVTGILGGKIRVDSPPGKGCTFTLTLPLDAPAAA
jgi:signal transduction histidine kinase